MKLLPGAPTNGIAPVPPPYVFVGGNTVAGAPIGGGFIDGAVIDGTFEGGAE